MLERADRRRVRAPYLKRRTARQRRMRIARVVSHHPVGERDHEPAKRPALLLDQPPARVARPAREARQPLQQLLLERPVQPFDLPLLPGRVRLRAPRHAPKRERRLLDRVRRELKPAIPPQHHRHTAELAALGVDRHRHPQRREHLRLRRAQRDRPPNDQPRELILEQRHPRPPRTLRPRRQHLDRQLLVISLIALAAKPRLMPQIHRPIPQRRLPAPSEIPLDWAQRPPKRPRERPPRRRLPALSEQLAVRRRDVPAPLQQQLHRSLARDHAPPRTRGRGATRDPSPHRALPDPARGRSVTHELATERRRVLGRRQPLDDLATQLGL